MACNMHTSALHVVLHCTSFCTVLHTALHTISKCKRLGIAQISAEHTALDNTSGHALHVAGQHNLCFTPFCVAHKHCIAQLCTALQVGQTLVCLDCCIYSCRQGRLLPQASCQNHHRFARCQHQHELEICSLPASVSACQHQALAMPFYTP